jgi:hypothetical protein
MTSMFEPRKKFELVHEGTYDARLIWLLDLGTHEDTYDGVASQKHKMYVGFELIGTKMEDGRPFMVGKSYTITNGNYGPYIAKTSNLSKMLRNWQKADEKTASKMTYLGGLALSQAAASITIVHEPNKKDPTRINIVLETIKAPKKTPPAAENAVLMYEVGQPFPERMPEWARKEVESCYENNGGVPARTPVDEMASYTPPPPRKAAEIDDDIPF